MIFYILSPIILLLLRRNKNFGYKVSAILIIISSILNGLSMLAYKFPPTGFFWRQPTNYNPDYFLVKNINFIIFNLIKYFILFFIIIIIINKFFN